MATVATVARGTLNLRARADGDGHRHEAECGEKRAHQHWMLPRHCAVEHSIVESAEGWIPNAK